LSPRRVRIWDLPTRLFHGALLLLVPALWATHHWDLMDLHILLGETMLGLILFRLFWGLIGGSTARFTGFVRGPRAIAGYLRGRAAAGIGHNPIGAISVVALLLLLAVQIGLGLFASDEDGLNIGPLSHLVSFDTATTLAKRHETMFYVLLALILVHVAAVLFYLFVRRRDLVTPMITGHGIGEVEMAPASRWRVLISASAAAALTWIVSNLL
jgi:cytochrome b